MRTQICPREVGGFFALSASREEVDAEDLRFVTERRIGCERSCMLVEQGGCAGQVSRRQRSARAFDETKLSGERRSLRCGLGA